MTEEWFVSWFDSPWYPVLYKHRDFEEAGQFINRIVAFLAPPDGSSILDLACGRGRHSHFLHQKGYHVTGMDLSAESIADAKKMEAEGLRFMTGDMRDPFPGHYDYIFNLFTSFGYFSDVRDNQKVLENVARALNPGGIFVLDYLNAENVKRNLVPAEEKSEEGIDFTIRRKVENGFIKKLIHVNDHGQEHDFEEKVQAFELDEVEAMGENAGLHTFATWGSYNEDPYNRDTSARMIVFMRKG